VGLRLADLLAALSLVTDLGMGLPQETALRVCLLATRLAQRAGLPAREVADTYLAALLRFVGCTSYAHEEALLFGGDDIALRAGGARTDFADPRQVLLLLTSALPEEASAPRRAGLVLGRLARSATVGQELAASHCEVAANVARRLALSPSVQQALGQMFERWDGKGGPRRLRGEDLARPVRCIHVAHAAVLFGQVGGLAAALDVVRRRAGAALDPSLADVFLRHGRGLLPAMDSEDVWAAVLGAELEPRALVAPGQLDAVARTMADVVDLKVPFTRTHSAGVAALAEPAARGLGCTEPEVADVRRAALLHDLGRVGVPNGIWEKPGPLSAGEWERVRLHPYHSERILARSPALAPLARIASMHHERQDGSGYHRQASGAGIPLAARVLAAADVYQACLEERPYRPAHGPELAARVVTAAAAEGRLDAEAVRAILAVGGRPARPLRPARPAGLSEREVEVLRLVARGYSTREIARRLVISPKTADHHVQHIYTKIGVSTRAAAALFAMQHDLLMP
jgi:HD-GYP domain-containing protein (c-di-GMP phosphodiesterase class II)/DNA-binding CsgD family transcriptional regulator